ncbi:MAG: hypothetical protein AAFR71_02635 [Pseudomonadota bacterium]
MSISRALKHTLSGALDACFMSSIPALADPSFKNIYSVVGEMFKEGVFQPYGELTSCARYSLPMSPAIMDDWDNGEFSSRENKLESMYVSLAMDLQLMERVLRAANVDEKVWLDDVIAYSKLGRSWAIYRSGQDLSIETTQAQQYKGEGYEIVKRLSEKTGIPIGGGCGDGEIFTRVASNPPGARIFLISEFDFRICKKQGYDPLANLKDCRWNEETGNSITPVAGNYQIQARWADGHTSISRRSFLQEHTGEGTQSIVVSR